MSKVRVLGMCGYVGGIDWWLLKEKMLENYWIV